MTIRDIVNDFPILGNIVIEEVINDRKVKKYFRNGLNHEAEDEFCNKKILAMEPIYFMDRKPMIHILIE